MAEKHSGFEATGDIDLATNSKSVIIKRVAQSAEPTAAAGELMIWRDTDDGKVYLIYSDADSGQKKIELI